MVDKFFIMIITFFNIMIITIIIIITIIGKFFTYYAPTLPPCRYSTYLPGSRLACKVTVPKEVFPAFT